MKQLIDRMQKYLNGSIWGKRILFSVLGAAIGYAYYYFIGCASGACPISSNPYISTMYGAVLGFVMTVGAKKPAGETASEHSEH